MDFDFAVLDNAFLMHRAYDYFRNATEYKGAADA